LRVRGAASKDVDAAVRAGRIVDVRVEVALDVADHTEATGPPDAVVREVGLTDDGEYTRQRELQSPLRVGIAFEVKDLELLVKAAQRLRAEDPPGGLGCRLHNDKFLGMSHGIALPRAAAVGDRRSSSPTASVRALRLSRSSGETSLTRTHKCVTFYERI